MQNLAVRDHKIGDVTSALILAHKNKRFHRLLQDAATGCCYRMLLQDVATGCCYRMISHHFQEQH